MDCLTACFGGKFTAGSVGCSGSRPQNIIATSVFELPNPYRDAGIYADGLLRLGYAVQNYMPMFTLRIYVDGSLMKYETHTPSPKWITNLQILANMPHVQIVYVACRAFFNTITHGHYDLFGTILRLMPMFETDESLPVWLQSPVEGGTSITFDTDIPDSELGLFLNLFRLFSESTYDIFSLASPCTVVPWNKGPQKGIHLIMAGMFATRIRFPRAWFEEYMEMSKAALQNPEIDNVLTRFVMDIKGKTSGFQAAKKVSEQKSPFVYGYDEIFINHILVPKIIAWERKTRVLEIVMNSTLTPIIRVLTNIRNGGFIEDGILHGPFNITNEHIQNILKILCETFHIAATFPASHEKAKHIIHRTMDIIKHRMNIGWLGDAYCERDFMSNEEYEVHIRKLLPILDEVLLAQQEEAFPPGTYFPLMNNCIKEIGIHEPFSRLVLTVGNGEARKEIASEDTKVFSERTKICKRYTRKMDKRRHYTRKVAN